MATPIGPISLARNIDVGIVSCPFAGMTRIRFKGSPLMRGLSAPTGAPLGTVRL
jgi:hypothetical protein